MTGSEASPLAFAYTRQFITFAAARGVVDAAIAKAQDIGLNVSICVVDPTGGVVEVARMDGARSRTYEAAMGKAFFAARTGRSTEDFIENRLKGDDALWRAISADPTTFMVAGGCPLMVGGVCVGGIGVSGGKHQDDLKVAEVGAAWLDAAQTQHNRTTTVTEEEPRA